MTRLTLILSIVTCSIVLGHVIAPKAPSSTSGRSEYSWGTDSNSYSPGPSSRVSSASIHSAGSDIEPADRGLIPADGGGVPTLEAIKEHITKENYLAFVNIGGTYGALVDSVSKTRLIESDHFPPKSVYAYAKHLRIKKMKERDMAAVSIDYKHHRPLITTGNQNNPYMKRIIIFMKEGNYYEAIRTNIFYYNEDPRRSSAGLKGRSFKPRKTILETNKSGIKSALKVHVKNKLVTEQQMAKLIREFKLNDDTRQNHFAGRDRFQAILAIHKASGI